ncbi:glycosyltransferase [bacterium]|nr:glycosyltransferase [bacterium]
MIIPAYNAGATLSACLSALFRSIPPHTEVILVDDGSTDGAVEGESRPGITCIRVQDGPRGPAYARNRGAESAGGAILVFIDADVAVHENTLTLIDEAFTTHPTTDALFGSYDDIPPASGWVSRYKNLLHHSVHQHGNREAFTFWAGCGAVRESVFAQTGGFDESFTKPSIEDIELGYRLRRQGYHIMLSPEIQVTHLKRWTLTGVVCTDILNRAVPWTRLIFQERKVPADLNLSISARLGALIVWLMLVSGIGGWFAPRIWLVLPPAWCLLWLLNSDLYRLFLKKGGCLFFAGAWFLHSFYLLYSSAVFVIIGAYSLAEQAITRKRSAG